MGNELIKYLEELKSAGISPEHEARIRTELATVEQGHDLPPEVGPTRGARSFSDEGDPWIVRQPTPCHVNAAVLAKSLDELLERDRQREADGFPRKIQVGKLVKPPKSAPKLIIMHNKPANSKKNGLLGRSGYGFWMMRQTDKSEAMPSIQKPNVS